MFDKTDLGSALVVALCILVIIYTVFSFGLGFLVGYYGF